MLRAELNHLLCQLIVHISFDAVGRFFLIGCFFADDLRAHWALRWECLSDRLSLEANNCFCNHGVEHT